MMGTTSLGLCGRGAVGERLASWGAESSENRLANAHSSTLNGEFTPEKKEILEQEEESSEA